MSWRKSSVSAKSRAASVSSISTTSAVIGFSHANQESPMQQLQKRARRRNGAVDFLIERPLRIEHRLVKTEQVIPDIDKLLPKRVAGRTEEGHALLG